MRKDNHSSVFVVNRQNQLQGLVTIDQALEAKKKNVNLLSETDLQEVYTTGPETALEELLPMLADMKWPVAGGQ